VSQCFFEKKKVEWTPSDHVDIDGPKILRFGSVQSRLDRAMRTIFSLGMCAFTNADSRIQTVLIMNMILYMGLQSTPRQDPLRVFEDVHKHAPPTSGSKLHIYFVLRTRPFLPRYSRRILRRMK